VLESVRERKSEEWRETQRDRLIGRENSRRESEREQEEREEVE
jgi:hypothetical protein